MNADSMREAVKAFYDDLSREPRLRAAFEALDPSRGRAAWLRDAVALGREFGHVFDERTFAAVSEELAGDAKPSRPWWKFW